MKTYVWAVILTVLIGGGGSILAPPTQGAPPAHNFYGIRTDVRDQASFVRTLNSPSLKIRDRQKLVVLFNQTYGARFGEARNWDELQVKLGSSDFEVRSCSSGVLSYHVQAGDVFGYAPRGCYEGELVLVHKASGTQVFSLLCGNMFHPPSVYIPPPSQVRAGTVYTNKCGIWILYGCHDTQWIERRTNQVTPYFERGPGFSGVIPQHD